MARRTSDDIINRLAAIYDIEIKFLDPPREVSPAHRGPEGHGCIPSRRLLLVEDDSVASHKPQYFLHELTHIIVQPPFWTMRETPEEFVLFQFERQLSKACFDATDHRAVVKWQEDTITYTRQKGAPKSKTYAYELALGDIHNYRQRGIWRRGFELCRRVGLLDKNNKPTWKKPDWSSFSMDEIRALKTYYRTREA